MKQFNLKSFALGVGATVLVAGLSVTALATSDSFSITVDTINIQGNGVTFASKDAQGNAVHVFSYNGTTYATLRALAEAYGLEVGYDAGNNMATVGSAFACAGNTNRQLAAAVANPFNIHIDI